MSKYNSKKTKIDGIVFSSKKESNYYQTYKMLERAGKISDLKLQPEFKYWSSNRKKVLFRYIADFSYFDNLEKKQYFIDVKGFKTPLYKLKKQLIEDQYNIKITEV